METMTAKEFKAQKKPKRSKFNNKKVVVNGHKFDSVKESKHYLLLLERERLGEIGPIELQPKYKLLVGDQLICTYIADFAYYDKELQQFITLDVKSAHTRTLPVYRIKNKLFKALFGREITEV